MSGTEAKKKILVLGSAGMAGHVMGMKLSQNASLDVICAARSAGKAGTVKLDVNDEIALEDLVKRIAPDVIVNCVGVLIKKAEAEPVEAIKANALLPHRLKQLCDKHGGRLVHLSTDCVFSGKGGPYALGDHRDGDTMYDRSKALGEVVNGRDLTIRTSITGPELRADGTGLFHWFMMQKSGVKGFANAYWSGVTTIELANYVEMVCLGKDNVTGIIHYSVSGGINKYDLLKKFNEAFSRNLAIERSEGEKVDKRLIPSPGLGRYPPSYDAQIAEMRAWIMEHASLYPHYNLKAGTS